MQTNGQMFSSQTLESHFIFFYEKFEGADHESAIYLFVSCIVSNLIVNFEKFLGL